jgi:hypothetical protein
MPPESVIASRQSTTYRVFRKHFEAGTVQLGGNELGFNTYTVVVDDGSGAGNSTPTISGAPPPLVSADREYSFTPAATDEDGDPLTFSTSNLPLWAVLDSGTGLVSGMPDENDVGTYSDILIEVTDGQATASLPPFSIMVNLARANSPPTISGQPLISVRSGSQYEFTPIASDPDDDPLNFVIMNRPTWARFNGETGRVVGTPKASNIGVYKDVVIRVADGHHITSLPAFSITVSSNGESEFQFKPTNLPPTISGEPPYVVPVNVPFSFIPTASDSNEDDLSYVIENRPSWARFDTRTGELFGTPLTPDVGTYEDIVIRVTDSLHMTSLPLFSLEVVDEPQSSTLDGQSPALLADEPPADEPPPNSPPTISGTPPAQVMQEQSYSFAPLATDDDGDDLSFVIDSAPP